VTYAAKTREDGIEIALRQCGASVKKAGNGRWELTVVNGRPLGVSARLRDNWLLLDATLTDGIAGLGWWELLRMNATLQGLSKFVVMPGGQSVHLRADIPLAEDQDAESDWGTDGLPTGRLRETCVGLKEAYRCFRGDQSGDNRSAGYPVSEDDRTPHRVEELRRLCVAAGLSFVERSEGKLMIDLDVRDGFYQACLQPREDGVQVVVEIGRPEVLGETNRQALSVLLLGTGGLVKLARPSVQEKENHAALRFDVNFTTTPSSVELGHAFAALSVACALSGREVSALQDDNVARDYLALVGHQSAAPTACAAGD
jgi:hypothetical protein